jgi:hypothetical protein
MTLQGRIQDFKLGGFALKEIAPSGGRRENFWGISCEKSRLYAKKSFSVCLLFIIICFALFQGRIQRGAHPARAPPKIGKNKICWRKIGIFHTKYPKKFRASLRNWKKYDK